MSTVVTDLSEFKRYLAPSLHRLPVELIGIIVEYVALNNTWSFDVGTTVSAQSCPTPTRDNQWKFDVCGLAEIFDRKTWAAVSGSDEPMSLACSAVISIRPIFGTIVPVLKPVQPAVWTTLLKRLTDSTDQTETSCDIQNMHVSGLFCQCVTKIFLSAKWTTTKDRESAAQWINDHFQQVHYSGQWRVGRIAYRLENGRQYPSLITFHVENQCLKCHLYPLARKFIHNRL